jgi:putative membrane protein insertion efficiency factor
MEKINRIIIEIPVTLIRIYQFLVSPILGQNCRFTPTCSQYSIESLRQHGIVHGLYLSIRRIISCRPGGRHGFDPVPKDGYKK